MDREGVGQAPEDGHGGITGPREWSGLEVRPQGMDRVRGQTPGNGQDWRADPRGWTGWGIDRVQGTGPRGFTDGDGETDP